MNRKPAVFLSASIPIAGRAPYDQDIERYNIREAILGLVTACRDAGYRLVFGGHPAISPLVHHASEALGNSEDITIYQSQLFQDRLPPAAKGFAGLRFTPEVRNPENRDVGEVEASVALMRDAMIDQFWSGFRAAVFIGGMEGIRDEFRRILEHHPGVYCLPIPSTGGATRIHDLLSVAIASGRLNEQQRELLLQDKAQPGAVTYATLFRRLLDGMESSPGPGEQHPYLFNVSDGHFGLPQLQMFKDRSLMPRSAREATDADSSTFEFDAIMATDQQSRDAATDLAKALAEQQVRCWADFENSQPFAGPDSEFRRRAAACRGGLVCVSSPQLSDDQLQQVADLLDVSVTRRQQPQAQPFRLVPVLMKHGQWDPVALQHSEDPRLKFLAAWEPLDLREGFAGDEFQNLVRVLKA